LSRLNYGFVAKFGKKLEIQKKKKRVREIRDDLFADADWRINRAEDAIRLNLSPNSNGSAVEPMAFRRQYLRDFTKQSNW
jgi:hypothetical protein